MSADGETIYALATAPGRAALAVIRISGPDCRDALSRICGSVPPPRQASLRPVRAGDGQLVDTGLVLWFPGPASYTGEDVAELHLHGGRAVVDGALAALATCPGLRLADPGEFTRRAFECGKLDLAQAEAVADLVDAETASQRRQALEQFGGALSRRHEAWRLLLLDALAWLSAAVDFPDEDLPEVTEARAGPVLHELERTLSNALDDSSRGRQIRKGYRIAIVGEPNAGKSTLLNALSGRDAAIVTATPGTTRDIIEVPLTWNGYSIVLADTAGLRETTDLIEAEGVRRAVAWAAAADLRLWLVDQTLSAPDRPSFVGDDDVFVLNKSDLPASREIDLLPNTIRLSAQSRSDVDALRRMLADRVTADLSGSEFPAATRARHEEALREALLAVRRSVGLLGEPELASEEVRHAAFVLQRVTGRIEVEQVLGRVFSAFCVGK